MHTSDWSSDVCSSDLTSAFCQNAPKYAKKRLFCLFWGIFALVKRRRAAGHLWRKHVAVRRFSRCFNTSKSGVQRKSNAVSGVSGPAGLAPQGWPRRVGPAGQLFSSSQATQCSYKFSEVSILVFTITQVNIYRHPIKADTGKTAIFAAHSSLLKSLKTVNGLNALRSL